MGRADHEYGPPGDPKRRDKKARSEVPNNQPEIEADLRFSLLNRRGTSEPPSRPRLAPNFRVVVYNRDRRYVTLVVREIPIRASTREAALQQAGFSSADEHVSVLDISGDSRRWQTH